MRLNQVVIEAALAYAKAGFSVIPIKADGSKRPPPLSWKPWQSRRPSPYEISQIFRGDLGIAVLGGKVSGGLEILDFDRAEFIDPWIALVGTKYPGLVARLPRIRTPKGGAHFYYRSKKIEGNQKLAQEPPSVDEAGNPKPNTLIETRGEGGYVLAPPSPAACHPRRVPYEHVAGPPILQTPEITTEERDGLLEAARGFNTWVPTVVDHVGGGKTDPGDRTLPGNDYNDRASWSQILEPAGWKMIGNQGDVIHWSRPGKTDGGMSATTGHCGQNLWVFSSNAQPFQANEGYTKFAAYCLAPETKVLTADLLWVPCGNLLPGDELVGPDESAPAYKRRKLRVSTVESAEKRILPCYKIKCANGKEIIASSEHPWLMRSPCNGNTRWIKTKNLLPNMLLFGITDGTWDPYTSRDAGYLAGIFDGEGWVGRTVIGMAQNPGLVLDLTEKLMRAHGFSPARYQREKIANLIINDLPSTLRFLGSIRPQRLLAKRPWIGRSITTQDKRWGRQRLQVPIVSIEHVGDRLVAAFMTSTRTFIAEGFVTHNTLIHHNGDYSQAAKALEKMGYGNREAAEKEVEEFEKIVSEPTKPKELAPFTPQTDYKKKKEERKSSSEKYFDGRTFLPELLSREICEKYRFIATPIGDDGFGTRVLVYRDGSFRPGGESVIVDEAYVLLGERANDNRITDVVKNVRISNKVDYKNLNVSAKELINVKNGMLDWKTGKLSPHDQKYLSTIQIDTNYEPDVRSEKIDKFLEMILAPDEIPVMEEFLGYLLIPETAFNKCLVVIGEGGNGKSTIMDLMMGFLGEDNISHYSLQHISEEKFSVAGLFGSLANFYDELQTKQIHDTATFKIITGGSPLKAEDKGKAPFSFRPFCRLVFSANEMPRADDRSQAYFDRFIFVKLPNRIRGTRAEILGYANVLLAMPGVKAALLNRAITGLQRLMKQVRFSSSASSTEAIEDYRRECNSAYDFVKEYCTFDDPTGWVSKQDLYDRYKIWCHESTRKAMSSRGFARGLETMNVRVVRHGEARGWGGIAWMNGAAPRTREDEVREFGSTPEQEERGGQGNLNF